MDAGGVDAVVFADVVDDGPGEGRVVVAGAVGGDHTISLRSGKTDMRPRKHKRTRYQILSSIRKRFAKVA